MSLYDSNGKIRVTEVVGDTYTGLHSSDGSFNGVVSSGNATGIYHSCGVLNITPVVSTADSYYAADGSVNVIASTESDYVIYRDPNDV